MNGLRRSHWIAALTAALLLHVGVAAAMVWPDEETSGAAMPGLAGLEISLGAAGGSPGVAQPVSAPAAQAEAVAASAAPVAPQQTEVIDAQAVAADAVPVEVTEAEPVEIEPVEAEPVEPVEAVEETPVETVVAEAVVEAQPEPAPLPQAKPAAPQPEPAPEAVESDAVDSAVVAAATTADPAGQTGEDGQTAPAGNAAPGASTDLGEGAGDASPGGGTPGAVADYYALLQAWLEQHRRYPSRARTLGQQGVAYVFFVVDGQGRVLETRLERSSGFELLDEEVLAMVARADPVPPIPPEMNKQRLSLVLPVAFALK